MNFKTLIVALGFTVLSVNKCAFKISDDNWPIKLNDTNNQPFVVQGMNYCLQYNGKLGCCDINNDSQQKGSYIQIDSVFGFKGSGCDHCGINLKRFWCQYACSPNQADFANVTDQNATIPDPDDPSRMVNVQKITLTVQAQTACDLYNSCKRISFVSSVSAMSSPAGFLTFQGHNAIDDANQYIDVQFSYDKDTALSFSDDFAEQKKKALTPCNTKINGSTWHEFKFNQNCKCNTCQEACDASSGFIYTESSVFEGFNWMLVGGVYLAFGLIAIILTIKRKRDQKLKLN